MYTQTLSFRGGGGKWKSIAKTQTPSKVSLIDRCSLTERERKKEEYESLRLVALSVIYIYSSVCVCLLLNSSSLL